MHTHNQLRLLHRHKALLSSQKQPSDQKLSAAWQSSAMQQPSSPFKPCGSSFVRGFLEEQADLAAGQELQGVCRGAKRSQDGLSQAMYCEPC